MTATLLRADDLIAWSDRVEAAAVLPELVRRLLLATALPSRLEMRAEAGIRLPGVDGLLETAVEGPFWPVGSSFWEVSVTRDVAAKAQRDYEKRTTETPANVRGMTSFVFVTSRRWSEGSAWAASKTAELTWAHVQVLDADGLAAWTARAPAVGLWFAASQHGRAVEDEFDLHSYLGYWAQRTRPQLPAEISLIGRDADVASLISWWQSPPSSGSALTIADETRDAALVFAVAALARVDEAAARAVVVTSDRALRWHLQQNTTSILTSLSSAPMSTPIGLRLIRAVPRSDAPKLGSLVLRPQKRADIARALVDAGLPPREAERLAEESGARLGPLQRILGFTEMPNWVREVDRDALRALLLAGAWEPRSEGDREIITLLGADPDAADAACATLTAIEDAPMVRHNTAFGWKAPGDVWKLLGTTLPIGALLRLEQAAKTALAYIDPAFELPAEERMFAPVRGKIVPYSSSLREGLAYTLARLSRADEDLRANAGVNAGSTIAARVVHEILAESWTAWASLQKLLPILAEAAPDTFLSRLQASVDHGDDGIARLLQEISSWSNPATGLLSALERLAWVPSYLDRTVVLLCELAERDTKNHNWVNRPSHSLNSILLPWQPQSATDLNERFRLLDLVIKKKPDVAWALLLSELASTGMLVEHPKPEFLPIGTSETQVPGDRVLAQISGAHARALELAGNDGSRLATLLEASYRFNDEFGEAVLQAVVVRNSKLQSREAVWSAVRELMHFAYVRRDTFPKELERLPKLKQAYDALEPASPVERIAWLFTGHPQIPDDTAGDYQRMTLRARELRAEAIRDVLSSADGWKLVAELGQTQSWPWFVAEAVEDAGAAEDGASRFLQLVPAFPHLGRVGAALVARIAQRKGGEWLENALKSLVDAGREHDASEVALWAQSTPDHWARIDQLGEPLRSRYWLSIGAFAPKIDDDVETPVRRFFEVGRAEASIALLSSEKARVPNSLIIEALEELLSHPPKSPEFPDMLAYNVEQLLERLDGDEQVPTETVAALQLRFLNLVREFPPTARLYTHLGSVPEEFVSLVKVMYRSSEDATRDPTEEETRVAEGAYTVLHHWKGYPGFGLAADARESKLLEWAVAALDSLGSAGRAHVGASAVAEVLARAPAAPDGAWPCRAARHLLESGKYPDLLPALRIAKRNLRGITSRSVGEGGSQERDLALQFRTDARVVRDQWPSTAELLRQLAESYAAEAERQDDRAEAIRDEEDLDLPDRAPAIAQVVTIDSDDRAPVDLIRAVRINDLRCIGDVELSTKGLVMLIGENGSGKSSLVEACELLRRASTPHFTGDVDRIHGGLNALLRKGAPQLRIGTVIGRADKEEELTYELSLVQDSSGATVLHGERLSLRAPSGEQTLFEYRGARTQEPGEEARRALTRVRRALERIEVQIPFDVGAWWAGRATERRNEVREAQPPQRTVRLDLFARNLVGAYAALKVRPDWSETMDLIHLVLPDFEEVIVQTEHSSNLSLLVQRSGVARLLSASGLADGELAWLALVAVFRLAEHRRSLLVLDEPDLHLHPYAIAQLGRLLERFSVELPIVCTTHSDALLDAISEAAPHTRICQRGDDGISRVVSLDATELSKWLQDYRGVGEIRAAGYLPAVLDS